MNECGCGPIKLYLQEEALNIVIAIVWYQVGNWKYRGGDLCELDDYLTTMPYA